MSEAHEVGLEILRQLGGAGRLTAMIGARYFCTGKQGCGSLAFQFPNRLRSKPNAVRVVLEGDDTYTVAFQRVGRTQCKELGEHRGVYADQLKGLIEGETGLYLSLGSF